MKVNTILKRLARKRLALKRSPKFRVGTLHYLPTPDEWRVYCKISEKEYGWKSFKLETKLREI